jgi:exodeoxyribonuclease-3
MKVATWNVNGIRARELQVLEFLDTHAPDVVCLQELKAAPEQMPISLAAPAGYASYWHGHKGNSGVGLLLKTASFGATAAFSHPDFDHETRIVEAATPKFSVASVYVPNGGKDYAATLAFLRSLVDWVHALHAQGRELVLCGDINIARADVDVHPKERKPGVIGQREEERALFASLLGDSLVDVTRTLDPDNDRLFTWWPPWRDMRKRNIGWRIDYILASPAIAARAIECRVLADIGTSDHAPIMMTLSP